MAAPKNISQEGVDEIVRLYGQNVTQRDIAKKFQIDPKTVTYHLKHRGVLIKNKNYFTEEEISLIVASYCSGFSLEDLCEQFHDNRRNIIHLLHRQNIPIRKNKRKSSFEKLNILDSEVLQKYDELQSSCAVAEYYNTYDLMISRVLARNNVSSFRTNLRTFLLENKEYITDRYLSDDGIGVVTIAAELDIDRHTLYKNLKKWGVKIREVRYNNELLERNKDEIHSLYYNDFLSIGELSDVYSLGTGRINSVFKKWGWEKRQHFCNTSIERKIKAVLQNMKIDFIQQFKFPLDKMKFDFCLPQYKLLIETHGDYWHGNPREYKEIDLDDIQKKNIKRDVVKKNLAQKHNYRLLCLWEWDINRNIDDINSIISKELNLVIT